MQWSLLSLLPLFLSSSVHAVNIPVRVRTAFNPSSHLHARADNNTIPVLNTKNAEYIANITLGGREIPVLLDTGSSDLWVTGSVPQTKDLGKSVSVAYAVGTAQGDINTADMDFAGYHVPDQAYLLVQNTSSFAFDIKSQGFEGLIGLGPNTGSVILDKLDNDAGNSVLNRIFSQNTTATNFLTLLLDRDGAGNQSFSGTLTVSELVPGLEAVADMPKLQVDKVHRLTDSDQHWQVYTDKRGVVGPAGTPVAVDSIVPSAPDDQLVAVFDSGFTLPQVPRALADAIYGCVQGAEYNEQSEVWTVPCSQEIALSFFFGGREYPIHPLDVSSSDFNMVDSTGTPVCVGTFQPITSAFSLLGEYDIILGMAFLRNTYTLFEYGDWVKDSSNDHQDPYIQLLSVTDKAQAHDEFVQIRMNGVDATNTTAHQLLPADQCKKSPISKAEKKKMYEEEVLSRWPEIFVGCLIFVLLLIGVVTWRCCVRRRRRQAAAKKAAAMGIATDGSGSGPGQAVSMAMAMGPGQYRVVDGAASSVSLQDMGKPNYDDDPYAYRGRKEVV